MVESLSSYKISEAPSDADETDVLACIAAVTAYIQVEEEELAAAAQTGGEKSQRSPWGETSMLEGAQLGTVYDQSTLQRKGTKLWRNFPGVLLLALSLTGLVFTGGARAQNFDESAFDALNQNDSDVAYTAQSAPGTWLSYAAPGNRQRSSKTLIKVALALGVGEVNIDAVDGAQILDMSTGRQIAALQPLSQWRIASRTANGAPAIAVTGRREADKYLIATGEQLKTNERNVSFFPSQLISPPALKAFEQSQQNTKGMTWAQKKAALGPSLIVSCQPKQQQISSGIPIAPQRNAAPIQSADGTPVPDLDEEEEAEEAENGTTQGSITLDPAQFSGITNGVIITPNQTADDGSSSVITLNGKMYRGSMWVKPEVVKDKNGASVVRLSAINVLDLEDYLMSVLPSEMPSSWPREALKAQAIAARSYAIANLGKYRSQGYDVKATVMDQAYRGAIAEAISSNRAVAETRGIVMKHGGKVVPGFFHSSSAGHTDVAEHVWTKEVPYLKSVPDIDHKSKFVLWERKFALPQIDNLLGKDVGTVLGLFPVHRSPAGRVKNLLVIGSKGTTFVSGTTVRQLFALPSTNFNVLAYQDSYLFKGQGFGHGLGMSQYGARGLAEHGYNAAQILTYYYKDVTFEHIVETPAL